MREDYSSDLIFSAGSFFVLLTLVGYLLSRLVLFLFVASSVFNPAGLWFWGAFGGFAVAILVSVRKYKLNVVQTSESALLGASFWLLIVFVANLAVLPTISLVLFYALFYYFEKNYRRFSWYKSGRAGFSGLAVTSLFFLGRAVASLVVPTTFSLIGRLELVPSAAASFLLAFSLYNLSEG
jgi:hypothetical protein